VLVAVVAQDPEETLLRTALINGWPLRRVTSAREGYRRIASEHPRVALVQVAGDSADAFALIRSLRDGPRLIRTVAVAADHDEGIERSARIAGASGYVAVADCPGTLEQAVAALLLVGGHDGCGQRPAGPERAPLNRTSSPLSSFLTEQRVAGCSAPPPRPGGGGDRAGNGRDRTCDKTRRRVSQGVPGVIQGESA